MNMIPRSAQYNINVRLGYVKSYGKMIRSLNVFVTQMTIIANFDTACHLLGKTCPQHRSIEPGTFSKNRLGTLPKGVLS